MSVNAPRHLETVRTRMTRRLSLTIHALVGWAICGATVAIGRQVVSMQVTLWIHAVVAPVAFALLTRHYFTRFPAASPMRTALAMLGVVAGLDALLVAPMVERSYAMFESVVGTWVPFVSIFVSSYWTASACRRTERTARAGV